MTTFTDRILRRFGLLSPLVLVNANVAKAVKQKRIEDLQKIPRYPPFMEGLPVYPPETLLETQSELIRRIGEIIANKELLDTHYYPAITRLANMYQLLPASQSHHHRGAGGLLCHSLEVGLYSLQAADGKLIRGIVTPQQRRLIEPRWRVAIFFAGICHDLGKVVTDFTVTDRSGEIKWHPYICGLYDWATQNKLNNYFIHWNEGRGKSHTSIAATLFNGVVSKESRDWISEGSTDVMQWLSESLTNTPGAKNQIYENIVKSDQVSVERDLKSMGVAMAGYEIGVPIERYLSDIMRNLLREGVWRINEPGARVWCVKNHTYLVWPKAGDEMAQRVREENIPGLPKSVDGILDMMAERGIALVREEKGSPFFFVAPDVLTAKIPDLRLQCIRLRDQALFGSIPIASIDGSVVDKKDEDANANETSVLTNSGKHKAANTAQLQINLCDQTTPSGAAQEKDVSVAVEMQPPSPLVAKAVMVEQSEVQPSTAQPAEQPQSSVDTQPAKLTIATLSGATGELLKVFLSDLAEGRKDAATLITRDINHHVYCKWPDSFKGYGFTGKQILDGLFENGWMEVASDTAKVGRMDFADGNFLSVKFTSEVSELFQGKNPSLQPELKTVPLPNIPDNAVETVAATKATLRKVRAVKVKRSKPTPEMINLQFASPASVAPVVSVAVNRCGTLIKNGGLYEKK